MLYRLPIYIKAALAERGLRFPALVTGTGYRNVAKYSRRFSRFERTGIIEDSRLEEIVNFLGLDRAWVDFLRAWDRKTLQEDFENWASVPFGPYLLRPIRFS